MQCRPLCVTCFLKDVSAKQKQQLQEKQKIAATQVHSLYPMLFTWHSRDILPSIPIAASVCWHGSVTLLLS